MRYLDWLRTFLTATVVIHHCFYIYRFGWWPYYGEWLAVKNDVTSLVCWTVLAFNQAYFMGLFFFISGLCAPPSLLKRGPWSYLKSRALRLLFPALVFDLLLAPLACVVARGVNDLNIPAGLATAPSAWGWYFGQYAGVGSNPCWFLWLLFLFDLALIVTSATVKAVSAWRGNRREETGSMTEWSPLVSHQPSNSNQPLYPGMEWNHHKSHLTSSPSSSPSSPYTSKQMSFGVLTAILVLSALSYLIRGAYPVGTWTRLFGFIYTQPAYLGQYAFAFTLGGILAASPQSRNLGSVVVPLSCREAVSPLSRLAGAWGPIYCISAFVFFVCGWIFVLILVVINAVTSSSKGGGDPTASLMGGWGLQALFYAVFEQTFSVLWSVGLLILARDHLHRFEAPEGTRASLVGALAHSAAYAAYLVHPLVVYLLVRGLTAMWPIDQAGWNVISHALVLCPLALGGTWALAVGLKAIPYVSAIL